jgi:FkbM family methyltransferase
VNDNYVFYGQQELDRFIFENFFPEKQNGFFVECGAFDGLTENTCKFFEQFRGWKGLNIEPTPYAFGKLQENRPDSINEQYALSSTNGKSVFTNVIHPRLGLNFGNGSLSHSKTHKEELISIGCIFQEFECETIRFEQLHAKHSLPEIDLFVLDVEGHEKPALQGILPIPFNNLPKVFCIEYTISNCDEITQLLSEHYTFHSKYFHNALFIKNIK